MSISKKKKQGIFWSKAKKKYLKNRTASVCVCEEERGVGCWG